MINTLNDMTLNIFSQISFHDIDVSNMSFDFKNRALTMEFVEFDEILNEDKKLTLTFNGVYSFVSDYPTDDFEFEVMGCNDAHCKKLTEQKYEVNFIFELDRKKIQPVYSLTIGFTSMDVMRLLSPKAIEFKNTYFASSWDKKEWFLKNNLPVPEWV
jgi:hypothetical protein